MSKGDRGRRHNLIRGARGHVRLSFHALSSRQNMSLSQLARASSRSVARPRWQTTPTRRTYSTEQAAASKPPSPHAQWYSDMLPGMIPVALLGSAVYIVRVSKPTFAYLHGAKPRTHPQGLRLYQANLAHERYLDETSARVEELERELEGLLKQQAAGVAVASGPEGVESDGKGRRGWLW